MGKQDEAGEALLERYDRLRIEMTSGPGAHGPFYRLPGDAVRSARALAALVSEEVEKEREANCKAIREACGPCGGSGYADNRRQPSFVTREMAMDAESPEMEGSVWDPGQDPTECEYCGRPIAAIRASSSSPRKEGEG